MTKSMLDIAHQFMQGQGEPTSFHAIWVAVKQQLPQTQDNQIGRFYKLMTLDGRFVAVGGNKWDLKSRYSFKELYDDARGVFKDEEEIEVPDELDEEDPFLDKDLADDADGEVVDRDE
jgi:DNA-directed RNA polymerase subunit delta